MSLNLYIIFADRKTGTVPKWLAGRIKALENTPFDHMAIAIEYRNQCFICHAVYPRPITVTVIDFLKKSEPIMVFKREVKNQEQMFEMLNYLAIQNSTTYYSLFQDAFIYLKRQWKELAALIKTSIGSDPKGLNCTEYGMRFLNNFFPDEFPIKDMDFDGIGLREAYEAVTKTLPALNLENKSAWIMSYENPLQIR